MISIKIQSLVLSAVVSLSLVWSQTGSAVYGKTTKISKTKLTLYTSQTKVLKVTTKKKIKWSSTNKKIAAVSKKGKVTAKKKGKATIQAKAGKKTYRCRVTVKNPSIGAKKRTVQLGTTYQFKTKGLKNVRWSSSDANKARVSATGLLTAYDSGKVTIKAKADKKSYQCQVTIKKGVRGQATVGTVSLLSSYDVNIPQLKNATYTSANEKVAVTTKGGMVKPVSQGAADINISGTLNGHGYQNVIHLNVTGSGVLTGIDLSSHNGDVDFNTLKSNNIDFAILRAGAGNIPDTKFVANAAAAKAAGMKVGVYWYLRSNDSKSLMTTQEAHDEALALVQMLQNNQISLDLPIYLDLESTTLYDKTNSVTYLETLVTAFRDVLIVYGYDDVGIYSNANYFTSHLNSEYFTYFSHIWLARYGYAGRQPNLSIAGKTISPEMWQSNQTYNVSDTNGSVDLNYMY